jgi:CheY-like chemotaxis protein
MPTPPSTDQPGAAALHGSVLYIEDEATSFAIVEALLSIHPDLRLLRAQTGDEGVRLARAERPDAILLDMHLPDISGIEVVRRLSEDIAAGAFRIILLTGDKLNIDVLKAMSLGAFEYLVKPVNHAALEGALGRALTAKERRRPQTPPRSQP